LKFTISLLLLTSAYLASAQDSLKLQSGQIIPVKITSIDHKLGLFSYSVGVIQHSVSLSTVQRYYIQDEWIENTVKEEEYKPEIVEDIRWYDDYFSKPIGFEMGRWSIATNLLAPFTGTQSINNQNYVEHLGYQAAPILTIEPEYRVSANVGLKFNVQFALNGVKQPKALAMTDAWPYYVYYDYTNYKTWGRAIYDLQSWYSPTVPPDYSRHRYKNKDEFPHLPRVVFQVGVYPKYYLRKYRKRSFYLSAGANVGVGDFQAVDYYQSFNVRENHPSQAVVKWGLQRQEIKMRANPFVFLRFEALAGMNFNIARQLAIGLEGGISTTLKNRGSEKDNIYVQLNEGDFKLVDSFVYQVEKSLAVPTLKLLLIYRFGH